ncbi:MAG: HpcH/HpaI aldolase/citrate lyase family protein [Acidiferrobacterales bacterium]
MTILRSLLFIPGNRPNMLEKGFVSNADALVPDLEDSVPVDEKTNARKITASFLPKLAESGRVLIPRVNALDTGLLVDDLSAVVGPHIFGVSVGKIQGAEDIQTVSRILDALEKKSGREKDDVKLVPWIETARAVVKVYDICVSSPRIIAVAFGAEDFTHDMGIERTEDDAEIEYASSTMCVAAKAADVLALDTPYFQFHDAAGLKRDAAGAKQRGFKGKFAIHPAQIDTINEVFSPSAAELDYARRVIAAFEQAERDGRGSTSLDGKVIDVPVVKRARALLGLAGKVR